MTICSTLVPSLYKTISFHVFHVIIIIIIIIIIDVVAIIVIYLFSLQIAEVKYALTAELLTLARASARVLQTLVIQFYREHCARHASINLYSFIC